MKGLFAILILLAAAFCIAPADAQAQDDSVGRALGHLGIAGIYETRVEEIMASFDLLGNAWSGTENADSAEERKAEAQAMLLQERKPMLAALSRWVRENYDESELQAMIDDPDSEASQGVAYAINFALSDIIMNRIMMIAVEQAEERP